MEFGPKRLDEGTQKGGEPPEEKVEVVSDSGEDRIDAVALAPFEIIPIHPMLGL